MDALESLLRPVASLLNKNIQESTPARALCKALDGSTVAIRVRDTALAAYFLVHEELLEVVTEVENEPDVVIAGSIITLAQMVGSNGESAIRRGSLDLSGDAETANLFQQLLAHAKPDIEEELSGVIGDVAAHRLGQIARGMRRWSRDARTTMGANIREYLQEESRELPSRYEIEKFGGEVDRLRDDVARIEARLNRLQNRL